MTELDSASGIPGIRTGFCTFAFIPLLYLRADRIVTIREVKHHGKPITSAIIPEVERKRSLLEIPRGHSVETALISLYGPDKSLSDAQYFDYSVTVRDILRGPAAQ